MIYRACLILVSLVALTACISSPPPKEVFYRFSDVTVAASKSPALEGNLRVERLKAEGILSERPMLFSQATTPGKIEQYRYHLWSEPPSTLLTQLLIKHLSDAMVAEQVVDTDIRTEVDYSVDGNLVRLERLIQEGDDAVVVELKLRLIRFKTRELILQKNYREEIPTRSDSITEAASAMSTAVSNIYNRFIRDLASSH